MPPGRVTAKGNMIDNQKLYEKVRKNLYKRMPIHSAYRSGLLVQEYKKAGGTYSGKKPSKGGLSRWFKEKWVTQEGSPTYKRKSDVFRPTKRITAKTPKTFNELTPSQIKRAQSKKLRKGRVDKF
tara:strand:+ start:4668 stop:5042 length:375 start_codon:yes stop_codon:yes gene_type:complete